MSKVNEWQHLKLPLKEIEVATENFKTLIGQGGYGWVYKGKLLVSGKETTVAVKRLNEQFGQGLKEFLTEIQLLSGQHHPNLVSLVGYCDEGKEKTIVYEYAERGSLDQYIRRSKKSPYTTLTWLQRLKICVDAARGLDHLHSHVGGYRTIIHRDIKSSNILIDENWVGKISDLGLSKLSVTGLGMSVIVSMGCGTHGYCEPEYYATGVLTKKSDVYSFGVVLFEVLCGRLCLIDHDDGFSLSSISAKEYYKNNSLDMIIDHSLKEHIGSNSMTKFAEIAYRCLHIDREQRPTMDVVVKELQEALRFLAREMEKRREGEPGEADVIVPANWNEALEIITYGSLEQSVEGMKLVCREFEAISEDPEVHLVDDLIIDADRLVSCLAAKVAKAFDISLIDASSRSCKHVLHTLTRAFQNKRFAHAVNQRTLDNLISELILWLLDERVQRMNDGSQLYPALNVLLLKILDNAERTSLFVVLISLLKPLDPSRWPSPPSNESFATKNMMLYDLVVKLLVKLTKVLQSTIYEVDLDRILQSIHVYLQELGMEEIRRRAGADDKPLRMVKTILHELVKLCGTAIKGHLSMVPIDMESKPIILLYIDLNLQTLAAANPMPASHSADAQLKQELDATGGSVPEDDRSVNVMPSRAGSIPVQSDFRQQHVDDQGNDKFQSGVSNSGIDATRERMKSIQLGSVGSPKPVTRPKWK